MHLCRQTTDAGGREARRPKTEDNDHFLGTSATHIESWFRSAEKNTTINFQLHAAIVELASGICLNLLRMTGMTLISGITVYYAFTFLCMNRLARD